MRLLHFLTILKYTDFLNRQESYCPKEDTQLGICFGNKSSTQIWKGVILTGSRNGTKLQPGPFTTDSYLDSRCESDIFVGRRD